MIKQDAIATIEQLIIGVLQAGGFKDFASIDKCREALKVLAALPELPK